MSGNALDGLQLLIIEDEFLIAMDIEQICRDHGARDVRIVSRIEDVEAAALETASFDAAIMDVTVDGGQTTGLARHLRDHGIPFVFATGYSDREEFFREFPGVIIVSKPYSGQDLIDALRIAISERLPQN